MQLFLQSFISNFYEICVCLFVCLFNVKECEAEILYLWETEMFVYTVRWMRFIKVGYFSIFFSLIRVQLKKNWKIVGWWGILRQWTTKEVVCLKETMAFKYRLFEPCDSLHFLPLVQTQRASAESRDKTTGLSPSLLCFVFIQMERTRI